MLNHKIQNREAGILTYGLTPPKTNHEPAKIAEIARKQIERIQDIGLDGLVLYDVQDEADRNDQDRPFPYLSTMDPTEYSKQYLQSYDVPKIIYKVVGKESPEELAKWIEANSSEDRFSVFVGSSSSKQAVTMRLPDAYEISAKRNPRLHFGGVVIPERHKAKGDEHLRVAGKQLSGCSFFISQATYDVEASKNFLSDYYYHCKENDLRPVPILFNLAPCGSQKTLEFMKWLGISIPRWLENDLLHSHDILENSLRSSREVFEQLFDFGIRKGIPIGCSVESVSTRKVEIEAAVELAKDIKRFMENRLNG
ncbi:5,10-methylenetetrahydrofolate reductase [Cohnella sp. AR92]|uniref:5,10-methylenetetrahydrofolate reductase n=1 Tax=Cohnella sp. AR92 TaxID=648716 RepID=UPI000F8CDFD9|nr:5,10-methylenetetrahydrofolate reductase [Cohnella sp. AR92]RUS46673.1 5,10-methylenetetrahydrofolate reductase [Cohnella sp. AR92]